MHFFWVLCLCVCNKKDCCVQTLCTQLQIICTLSKLLFQCELLLVFRKSANIILISMWTIINLLEIFQQNDYFMRTIIKISRVSSWQKVLKNITCGWGNHLWKYSIYHLWPAATRDKFNIFTRDYLNHPWYFPILFASYMGIFHWIIKY